MNQTITGAGADPGVPEAAELAVRYLREHVDPGRVQHLWFFPPLRQGRRETGLLAASLVPATESTEEDRRVLVTVRYAAEATGKGVRMEPALREEGEAPPDRIPRVIAGVLQRSDVAPGDPKEVAVEGNLEVLRDLAGDGGGDGEENGTPGAEPEGMPTAEAGSTPARTESEGSEGDTT